MHFKVLIVYKAICKDSVKKKKITWKSVWQMHSRFPISFLELPIDLPTAWLVPDWYFMKMLLSEWKLGVHLNVFPKAVWLYCLESVAVFSQENMFFSMLLRISQDLHERSCAGEHRSLISPSVSIPTCVTGPTLGVAQMMADCNSRS